jgi:polysaccharide deacetylase family protein (PEP-CTERM system associated)
MKKELKFTTTHNSSIITNALSIDLEDWFCANNLSNVINKNKWNQQDMRVEKNAQMILQLLDKHSVKATFFVLGWIADRLPSLINEIAKKGHEIATHGYSHTLLYEMTPESFEEDLKRAIEATKIAYPSDIIGYRAPSFTITKKTTWAFEILAKNGIRYDSSVFPIRFHPDYGMREAPLFIYNPSDKLIEFPLTCVDLMGKRIPCCGGGYFRILPYLFTRFLLRRCNKEGRPVMFYLHPWEIDPGQPRVKLSQAKRFRHYNNLNKTFGRLDRLLTDFKFSTAREVLGI